MSTFAPSAADARRALRAAAELEDEATAYERMVQRHGRSPVWIKAACDDRETAGWLRRLASVVRS